MHIFFPFLPFKQNDLGYYKNRDNWAKDISQLAAGRPVLFVENFREAGLYTFYTGQLSSAAFNNQNRQTQYDLWKYEDSLQGKEVLLVGKNSFPGCSQMNSRMMKMIYYMRVKKFESYSNIQAKMKLSEIKNDTLHISMEILNDRKTDLNFYADSFNQHPVLFYQLKKGTKILETNTLKVFSEKDKLKESETLLFDFDIPVKSLNDGTYYLATGFSCSSLPPSFLSMKNKFIIRKGKLN